MEKEEMESELMPARRGTAHPRTQGVELEDCEIKLSLAYAVRPYFNGENKWGWGLCSLVNRMLAQYTQSPGRSLSMAQSGQWCYRPVIPTLKSR